MSKLRTDHPFKFVSLSSMVELTGHSARTLKELVEHIKAVPGAVIYYHTHHFLKQHQSLVCMISLVLQIDNPLTPRRESVGEQES